MNILIIEDEKPAADRLKRLLRERLPQAYFHGHLDSVSSALEWLGNNPAPDLVFLDIQLADGLSFEIFKNKEVLAPVIFCTAFDQYAIRAFELNSVDYLLKPIDPKDLDRALSKFQKLNGNQRPAFNYEKLVQAMSGAKEEYKQRFVVKVGDRLMAVPVEEIAFFYSESKSGWLQLFSGRAYPIDFAMDQVEKMVDPEMFFRLNRKYIASLKSIAEIRSYSSSRLKISLEHCADKDILISREKVNAFKQWLDR